MARAPAHWWPLLVMLVILPFFTSYLVRTVSWQLILSDDSDVEYWARVGFMYGHGFTDLDGHMWEVVYMDPAAVPPAA